MTSFCQAMSYGQHALGMDCHPERPEQAQEAGPSESHEVQHIQVQGLAPELWQPPLSVQGGRYKDGVQPYWKGLGVPVDGKELEMQPHSPEHQQYPGLQQKMCDQ